MPSRQVALARVFATDSTIQVPALGKLLFAYLVEAASLIACIQGASNVFRLCNTAAGRRCRHLLAPVGAITRRVLCVVESHVPGNTPLMTSLLGTATTQPSAISSHLRFRPSGLSSDVIGCTGVNRGIGGNVTNL